MRLLVEREREADTHYRFREDGRRSGSARPSRREVVQIEPEGSVLY